MDFFDLTGKVALVTGGGSGMGFGISEALCRAGAKVIIGDLNELSAKEAASNLNKRGFQVLGVKLDASNLESFKECMEEGLAEYGTLDILVNNAAVTIVEDIFKVTQESWDRVFNLNTRGLFFCCQAFAKHLIENNKGGNIINIASNAAKVSFIGQVHYNASKAAVVNITQSLAKEFAKYQINVNAVCPGACDTEMLRDCMLIAIEESGDPNITIDTLREQWSLPQIGRLSTPMDIGRIIVFLASDASVIIRGQSINVDAGGTPC